MVGGWRKWNYLVSVIFPWVSPSLSFIKYPRKNSNPLTWQATFEFIILAHVFYFLCFEKRTMKFLNCLPLLTHPKRICQVFCRILLVSVVLAAARILKITHGLSLFLVKYCCVLKFYHAYNRFSLAWTLTQIIKSVNIVINMGRDKYVSFGFFKLFPFSMFFPCPTLNLKKIPLRFCPALNFKSFVLLSYYYEVHDTSEKTSSKRSSLQVPFTRIQRSCHRGTLMLFY